MLVGYQILYVKWNFYFVFPIIWPDVNMDSYPQSLKIILKCFNV